MKTIFVCGVTGAKIYNRLCFSVGRLIKKMAECFIFRMRLKLKDFRRYNKEKNMPEV